MQAPLVLIFILLNGPFTSTGKLIEDTWTISYISGNPDGVRVNHVLGINGKFPGPTIEGEVGDELQVKVLNKIQGEPQDLSIHWHGFHQRGTPFQDGPSYITQCPIITGSSQTYRFKFDIPGTFWYHSHVKGQYTEGLWGVIIVRNTPEIYASQYEDEITITLNDWHHGSAIDNENRYLKANGSIPVPDSILLNAVGRYPCDLAASATPPLYCTTSAQKRAVFKVAAGKAFRLRVINTSGLTSFNFSIEGHSMEIIEVDSVDVRTPVAVTAFKISAAQRYSAILRTNAGGAGETFIIRAQAVDVPGRSVLYPNLVVNDPNSIQYSTATGVLVYTDINVFSQSLVSVSQESFDYTLRLSNPPNVKLNYLNEMLLFPHDQKPAPDYVKDKNIIELSITNTLVNGVSHLNFNEQPFNLPDKVKPLLSVMMENGKFFNETRTYEISYMDTIELRVFNANFPHPLHLHGHHFWVVYKGEPNTGPYNPDKHDISVISMKRDTVLMNTNSSIVLRFVADNPGFWTFHCHIDWHMLSGLVINFAEAGNVARNTLSTPLEARRICREQGVII